MVLEETLESPLDCKEIQPVNPKGNGSWIFIGRTDAEAEAPILSPPDVKSWLIRKDPDAWKDWRQEEKGTTEDEMVGWHHRLDGLEFEQAPGDGEGQWSLACCSPWGCKELDTTERLNNNEQFKNRPLLELSLAAGRRKESGMVLDGYKVDARPFSDQGSYPRSVSSATFLAVSQKIKQCCKYWKIPAEWVPINNHKSPKVTSNS